MRPICSDNLKTIAATIPAMLVPNAIFSPHQRLSYAVINVLNVKVDKPEEDANKSADNTNCRHCTRGKFSKSVQTERKFVVFREASKE